jgi:hypothetical protein
VVNIWRAAFVFYSEMSFGGYLNGSFQGAHEFSLSPKICDLESANQVPNNRIPTLQSQSRSIYIKIHNDEGWRLHQPASLRQGGFHESGMWPF